MKSDPERLMGDLSRNLGLVNERQDWGIINANAERVREFMQYFEKRPLASTQLFAMGELIIASMNEALLENTADRETLEDFKAFVRHYKDDIKWHFQYWASLPDNGEFPVSITIKKTVSKLSED